MKLNDELFDQVLQRIDNDPDAFDMGQWMAEVPSCNTVACLAGHTILELGYKPYWHAGRFYGFKNTDLCIGQENQVYQIASKAAEALGLTVYEAQILFSAKQFDEQLGKARLATRDDVIMRWKMIKDARGE